ncbi:hypothetical protein HHI_04770 [Hyphomonas hirschiana VP5]|uniref:PilZ domain-containing protein n=1 Tax=Hyphomonas hirschiana VP5 TaxID=1280951 RepID=A0A059FXK3_9PROT|nr:hypothetical protein HHI_04770 [Hyphomonas hirschiana VP5]
MIARTRPARPAQAGSVPRSGPRSGKIVIGADDRRFSISLQRLSPKGAQLRQTFPFPVPDTFSLVIFNPFTNCDDEHACEKVWQRGDLVSARFL